MSNVISAAESGKTTLGVILDAELRERLERAAREHERSLGGEVRALLRQHLERGEEEEAA